ncbi:unnamed protein product [Musa banksii]
MSSTCVRVFLPFPFPFRANSATTTFSFLFYPLCNSPSPLMVERVPPCTPPSPEPQPAPSALLDTVPVPADPNPGPGPDPDPNPSRRLGTYVVRVPKDQVYRVPPPENAKLAERYRNQNRSRRRGSPCLSCLKWILGVAFLVLLLIVAVTVIFFVVVRPGAPTFTVQRLFVEPPQHHGSAPEAGVRSHDERQESKSRDGFLLRGRREDSHHPRYRGNRDGNDAGVRPRPRQHDLHSAGSSWLQCLAAERDRQEHEGLEERR